MYVKIGKNLTIFCSKHFINVNDSVEKVAWIEFIPLEWRGERRGNRSKVPREQSWRMFSNRSNYFRRWCCALCKIYLHTVVVHRVRLLRVVDEFIIVFASILYVLHSTLCPWYDSIKQSQTTNRNVFFFSRKKNAAAEQYVNKFTKSRLFACVTFACMTIRTKKKRSNGIAPI